MREDIQHAMNHLAQDNRLTRVNLTGEDAQLMKGRQGIMPANGEHNNNITKRTNRGKKTALKGYSYEAGSPVVYD